MTQTQKVIKYLAISLAVFLTFSIISAITYGVISVFNIFDDNDNVDYLEELDITEDTSIIDIQVNSAVITIKSGDTLKVETNNKYITTKEENNKTYIKEKKHNWFGNRDKIDLVISVPTSFTYDVISISSGAGKVDIDRLTAKKIYLDLGAGKVSINYLEALEEAKINGGAGEIEINGGTIYNLDFDIGIGKTTLISKIEGNSKIDAGIGEVNLTLLGNNDDYKIKADKGIGDIVIGDKKASDNTYYGKGDNLIEIDGGIGSIHIDYKNIETSNHYTKTYTLLNKTSSPIADSYYLTLQVYQGEVDTVLVSDLKEELAVGSTYEFYFEKLDNHNVEDNIKSIFDNSKIISIIKTDKEGLEQIQDDVNS